MKYWNWIKSISPFLLILLTLLLLRNCEKGIEEKNRYQDNIEALNADLETSKSKLGQEIASKQALEVTNEELKKEFWIKDDSLQDLLKKYRKVNVAAVIQTKTLIPAFKVGFETSIPGDAFIRRWKKEDPFYYMSGVVTNNYVGIDSLQMFNTQRFAIGIEKGFFSNTLSASVTNSNPYIQTTDLTTQVIKQRNKRFGLGVIAGIDPTGKPIYGLGGSYSFLQF